MFKNEVVLLLCAVIGYAGAFILLLSERIFNGQKDSLFSRKLFAAFLFIFSGALLHGVSLLLRWLRLGFFPFIDAYTSVSGCALTGIVIFLVFSYKLSVFPSPRNSKLQTPNSQLILWALCLLPSSFLLMGFGLMSRPEIKTLSPALQSIWLYIHVSFAIITQGSYFVAATIGILYFIQKRNLQSEIRNSKSRIINHPSPTFNHELLIYRFIALGFMLHAVMVISGAIWAQNAWGRYWGWDPIEIWSLITWFIYGIFLHLRITYKWHGNKVAAYSVGGFLLTIFCYYLVPHVYSGSLHVDTKF